MAMLQILKQEGVVPVVGPCGCGKTLFISLAVVTYVKVHPNKRVVIYAETNDAVDENMKRIAASDNWKAGQLLRVVNSNTMNNRYPQFSLTAMKNNFTDEWMRGHNDNRGGLSSQCARAGRVHRARHGRLAPVVDVIAAVLVALAVVVRAVGASPGTDAAAGPPTTRSAYSAASLITAVVGN
ncbi:hypothetical protein PF003_g29134 [Phytophthora fragariae]|nr:hypothetical protein PF003_g29134 [Phytophthora fragariae]